MKFSTRRNKFLTALLCALGCVFAAQGGEPVQAPTARKVFENLQAPALELLKKTTRLDMLDYWDADSVRRVQNALGGLSWLTDVTDSYLKVQLTPVSTLEIKLLPDKDTKDALVMTVYTVGDDAQARDSQVDFYTTAMQHLDTEKYLDMPDLKDFVEIPKGSATKLSELRGMVPFPTVEYSASAGSNDLTARLTVGKYMNTDDYNILRLFLKPEIKAPWKGKYKFRD